MNFYLFLSFIIGIILGWEKIFSFPLVLLLSTTSIMSIYLFYKRNNQLLFGILLIVFFILLGVIWIMPHSLHKPDEFLNEENRFLIKVTSLAEDNYLKRTFYAQVKQIDNWPASLKVKVNDFSKEIVEYRSVLLVRGKLTRYKFKRSYFYTLWLKKGSYIKKFEPAHLDRFLRKLNYKIVGYLKDKLSSQAYRFLSSVFLGRRELIDKDTKIIFVEAGCAHLLAISGLHVGLVSLVLFFALKIFRIRFRQRLLLSIVFLFLYTLLVGARPSTVRASVMYSIFGIGYILRRRVDLLNSLGLSGLVCLFLNPIWVFDIGFQLSFTSVLGIILGFRFFHFKLPYENLFIIYMKNIFLCTVFVTVAIIPLVSFYFGRIYLLGFISNMILIPFFTFILIVSFIFLTFYISPFIAVPLGEVLSFSIFLFIEVASFLSSLKLSFIPFWMPLWLVFIYYLILFFLVFFYIFLQQKRKAFLKG